MKYLNYSNAFFLVKKYFSLPHLFYLLDEKDCLKLLTYIFNHQRCSTSKIHLCLYHCLVSVALLRLYGESSSSSEYFQRAQSVMRMERLSNYGGKFVSEVIYSFLYLAYYSYSIGNIHNAIQYSRMADSIASRTKNVYHRYNAKFQMYSYFMFDVFHGIFSNIRNGFDPNVSCPSVDDHHVISTNLMTGMSQIYTTMFKGETLQMGKVNTTVISASVLHMMMDLTLDTFDGTLTQTSITEKYRMLKCFAKYIDNVQHTPTKKVLTFLIYSFQAQILFIGKQEKKATQRIHILTNILLDEQFHPFLGFTTIGVCFIIALLFRNKNLEQVKKVLIHIKKNYFYQSFLRVFYYTKQIAHIHFVQMSNEFGRYLEKEFKEVYKDTKEMRDAIEDSIQKIEYRRNIASRHYCSEKEMNAYVARMKMLFGTIDPTFLIEGKLSEKEF